MSMFEDMEKRVSSGGDGSLMLGWREGVSSLVEFWREGTGLIGFFPSDSGIEASASW